MTRPQHRRRPKLHKSLVCAALAIALQLSLLAVPELPEPISELGTPPAAAQSSRDIEIVDGTADACPTDPIPWSPMAGDPDYDTEAECRLELPACPVNPLWDATLPDTEMFMLLSSPPASLAGDLDTSFRWFASQYLGTYFPASGVEYPNIGLARYTDFCELRVLDTHAKYADCTAATGVMYELYVDRGMNGCRLIRQIKCPDGIQFATSKTCRGVQRRTWTCGTNETHHNVFNRCIRQTTPGGGTHPACNPSPSSISDAVCEAYAGSDYDPNPALTQCANYDTETFITREYDGNRALTGAPTVELGQADPPTETHWCSYSSHALRKECHYYGIGATYPPNPDVEQPSDCATSTADSICIKRIYGTGGCADIAHTIKCRAYEAAHEITERFGLNSPPRAWVPLDYVRSRGCQPCLVLPFRPPPSYCDEELDRSVIAPAGTETLGQANALASRRGTGDCAAPPAGWLDFETTSPSRLVLVDSPVVVTLEGIELNPTNIDRYLYTPAGQRNDPSNPLQKHSLSVIQYTTDSSADTRVRTWRDPGDPSWRYSYFNTNLTRDRSCTAIGYPSYQLVVRELWPDWGGDNASCVNPASAMSGSDAAIIWTLFGERSLDWWCGLSDSDREARTSVRGLRWWPDLTLPADQNARNASLIHREPCELRSDNTVWCRWIPERPGFYSLYIGAAWRFQQIWYLQNMTSSGGRLKEILDYLNGVTVPPTPPIPLSEIQRRQDAVEDGLDGIGPGGSDLDWVDIGLERIGNTVSALPRNGTADDWTFRDTATPQATCPAADLRIRCYLRPGERVGYTETPPVGVMVHEARVVTRAPSR